MNGIVFKMKPEFSHLMNSSPNNSCVSHSLCLFLGTRAPKSWEELHCPGFPSTLLPPRQREGQKGEWYYTVGQDFKMNIYAVAGKTSVVLCVLVWMNLFLGVPQSCSMILSSLSESISVSTSIYERNDANFFWMALKAWLCCFFLSKRKPRF